MTSRVKVPEVVLVEEATFIAYGRDNVRGKAANYIREYLDSQLDLHIEEFYGLPDPIVASPDESSAFEVLEGAELYEDALMKVFFLADGRAQARYYAYQKAPISAVYDAIRTSHDRLDTPIHNIFEYIPAPKDNRPYQKMLTLRRASSGEQVRGGYGINYAAKQVVGDIVLAEPELSVAHPDLSVQKLIKRAFLRQQH